MNQSEQRMKLIKSRIEENLSPEFLNIIDESHLHEGHPEAEKSGGGHFYIEVVSDKFADQQALARHKMIYLALGDAMGTEIHALSIDAKTKEESLSPSKENQEKTEGQS